MKKSKSKGKRTSASKRTSRSAGKDAGTSASAPRRRGGRKAGTWTVVTPEKIRAYREANGISRATLARLLGVSSTSVVNWETGRAVASLPIQARLQELLTREPLATLLPPSGAGPAAAAPSAAPELEVVGKILVTYLQNVKIEPVDLPALVKGVRGALS